MTTGNDLNLLAELTQSFKLEFITLSVFMAENALDVIALLVYFCLDFKVFQITSALALSRLVLLTIAVLIEQKTVTGKTRNFLVARKVVIILFWLAVSVCSLMNITYLPTIGLLLLAIGINLRENCSCSGEVT